MTSKLILYKLENSYAELTAEERLNKRQLGIKPIVDAFFVWLDSIRDSVPAQSKTGKAITYCLNQKVYLREFLNDGNIPIDNNAALCPRYFYPHLFLNTA